MKWRATSRSGESMREALPYFRSNPKSMEELEAKIERAQLDEELPRSSRNDPTNSPPPRRSGACGHRTWRIRISYSLFTYFPNNL